MRERACNNCGGKSYEVVGQNMVKCMFCGTLYVDEQASKDEEFLIARANDFLREFQFETAFEEFDKIISLYPLSFEAFFGRALAKNKIVLYPNKRGILKRPCFFGEKIVSLNEDEDFKQAVSLAPQERAKRFLEISKRADKIKKIYDSTFSKNVYDCILCVSGENEEKKQQIRNEILKMLNENELSVFDCDDFAQNETEETAFRALETAKIFVFCALEEKMPARIKSIFDRYFYLTALHKKTRSSFVLCLDEKTVKKANLPKQIQESVDALDTNSISFLQDLEVRTVKEFENSKKSLAKIDTIKIQKAQPKKKEYVDIDNILPEDLGHYDVKNVAVTPEAKKKWIFLSLKNGDFETAKKLIEEELENDAYDSELLLAQYFAEKNIRTEDEFFSKISNFSDKARVENILRYASKSFAENFVDRWEMLVKELDEVDYFNQYLIFLASYKTPNRDNFIESAESKAVETLDEQLIQNVEKCFGANEVERFEKFYFLLAQKSDDKKYYQKILDIDAGHAQSNIALMLRKFETPQDKLSYRNREEVENMLKFLDENSRVAFVSAVVDMILPVAFFNLQEAEKQLDFYLAYIQDKNALVSLLRKIGQKFQEMQFFKMAEKYISIAISKCGLENTDRDEKTDHADAQNDETSQNGNGGANIAELYWDLIKIKCHCRNDEELVMSKIKPTDFPEWQTLLEVGDDTHDEMYGAIVSKNNLYSGKKMDFQQDLLDKEQLKDKLQKFALRNKKILLDIEKQEGISAKKGVDYFRIQLKPFEKYVGKIDHIEDFEDYQTFFEKIQERLSSLDMSLDASVSVIEVQNRSEALSNVEFASNEPSQNFEKQLENIKKQKVLKTFLIAFLEFFPLCFATLLLVVSLIVPKEVYLYFSQTFLIVSMMFSVFVAGGNLLYYFIKKQSLDKKKKSIFLSLVGIGVLNLLLFVMSFYLIPAKIKITNENELQTLMKNAPYSNFVLEKDLDYADKKWTPVDLKGSFDGKNHQILNLNNAFLRTNQGEVKNLTIQVTTNLSKVGTFGAFVCENSGEIENCVVYGELHTKDGQIIGGFAGVNSGLLISCESKINISIETQKDVIVGGLVGENRTTKKESKVTKSSHQGKIYVKSAKNVVLGGLIGKESSDMQIFENFASSEISVTDAQDVLVGGLVGSGQSSSKNNYACGTINTNNVAKGYVGGLYGSFSRIDGKVEFSYSDFQTNTSLQVGQLVGNFAGRMNSCFATQTGDLCAKLSTYAGLTNCEVSQKYDPKFDFDQTVWDLSSNLPKFLWETA